MKYSCGLVQDLLPLYHDEVCSQESRSIVEEHLLECDNCKEALVQLKEELVHTKSNQITELKKSDALKKLKQKLFRKKVMISLISVICAIVVCIGGFMVAFHYQMPIAYEEELLGIEQAYDGVIDIWFNGDNYYSSYGLVKTVDIDGDLQNVAFIYYTDTLWTKFGSNPFRQEPYQFSIGNNIMVDYGKQGESIASKENISAVYYLIDNYRELAQMPDEEFLTATQEAILLWEK